MWKQRWELHSAKPRHRKDGCQVPEAKTREWDRFFLRGSEGALHSPYF